VSRRKHVGSGSLPSQCRIRRSADIEHVLQRGERLLSQHWILRYATGGFGEMSRLAIVTTRRSGKSHDRARLRRVVREFFRTRKAELAAPQDVLLIARAGAGQADNATLRAELARLWEKLKDVCRK